MVDRFSQPVMQTVPGPEFKMEVVPLLPNPKGEWVRFTDYDTLAALLTRDIRPLLDGMRGQMPEGLGKRAIATLVTRIDGLVP